MFQSLIRRVAFFRVDDEQLSDEVHRPRGDIVPVGRNEFELAADDDVEELVLIPVRTPERRKAAQQDISDNADRPVVHFEAISIAAPFHQD